MADANFQPIFDYIDNAIGGLKEEIPSKADFNRLQKTVDGIAKSFDRNEKESIVTKARVERIEHWVMKAAEKTDTPYES